MLDALGAARAEALGVTMTVSLSHVASIAGAVALATPAHGGDA